MKRLIVLAAASTFAIAAAAPAQAAQGCGPGMHRTPHGRCVSNGGSMAQTWVEGRYYRGHGYWHQNRWWHHRDRDQDNWRYR